MKSIEDLKEEYAQSLQFDHSIRFGQYFCNNYLNQPYPVLYYETDFERALNKINDWLILHNYQDELPQKIDRS